MNLRQLAYAAFVAFATPLAAQTITFDNLPTVSINDEVDSVPNGYSGFNWGNFYYGGPSSGTSFGGYTTGVVSQPYMALNGGGNPATMSGGVPFDLASLYLTSAFNTQTVTISGYNGATLEFQRSFTVGISTATLERLGFTDITSVVFTSSIDSQFVLDNLTLGPLVLTTDFAGTPGLNANQRGIASSIDAASAGTSSAVVHIVDAVGVLPVTDVAGALNQLAPTKFHQFASTTAFNNATFDVQDMDIYLDGDRTGPNGTFVGGNGQLDTHNFVVNDPNVDPGLQMIHSRMLAWNDLPSVISDVPGAALGGVEMKDSKNMKSCPSCNDNPWNVFVRGSVVLAQGFSQADVPHFDDNTASVTAGADYRFTPNLLTGVTLSYAHTDATLDDFGSSATVDSYSPGVYASYADSGWYANFIGRYSYNSYTEQRKIAFLNQTSDGETTGNEGLIDLDGGYDFHSGPWTYGPVAGLQYTHLTVNEYQERNSDASLSVDEDQSDSLRSRLGGEVRFDGHWCGATLSPHLTATWQHEFMDQSRGITSQFTQFSGGSFAVRTESPSQDSALVDLGLDAQVDKTITVFGDYVVEAGQSNYFGQSVQAGVKVNF